MNSRGPRLEHWSESGHCWLLYLWSILPFQGNDSVLQVTLLSVTVTFFLSQSFCHWTPYYPYNLQCFSNKQPTLSSPSLFALRNPQFLLDSTVYSSSSYCTVQYTAAVCRAPPVPLLLLLVFKLQIKLNKRRFLVVYSCTDCGRKTFHFTQRAAAQSAHTMHTSRVGSCCFRKEILRSPRLSHVL